jgi:hypothetical protein
LAGSPLPELKRAQIIECKRQHPDWSQDKIARCCKVSHGTVSNVLLEPISPEETREQVGDKLNISLPKTRIHTLEELIEYCKIDLSIWEVERFVANKWEMGYKGDDGKPGSIPLFQIKATLIKKKEIIAARRELEELKKQAFKAAPAPRPIKRAPAVGNLLEINIPDLHVGKLAWAKETGQGSYDSKIACALFRKAVDVLLERTKGHAFESVLFVVGNDLLHSDTPRGATYNGTPLDNDSRYHKTFSSVRTLIVESIERLRAVAPVKVVMVQGNHDTLSVWHLGDSLECYFHKYKDVEIDNSPRQRKYHQFGQVMLMFTHGDKGKRQDYPLLMATEQPGIFGSTKYREAHTGHLHMTKLDEQHGVRVRVLPALCDADAWHAENGMIGNLRNAEAYIWNRDEGLIGTAIYSASR